MSRRKLMTEIAAVGILLLAMAILVTIVCGKQTSHKYPMTGIVRELDEADDAVVVEDINGNRWAFLGIEDWEIGDIASIIMNDVGTEIIYDDVIVSVRYSGNLNMVR